MKLPSVKEMLEKRRASQLFGYIERGDLAKLDQALTTGAKGEANSLRIYKRLTWKETLLGHAVEESFHEAAFILLSHGADPNLFDGVGRSPFTIALSQMRPRLPRIDRGTIDPRMPYDEAPIYTMVLKLYMAGGDPTAKAPITGHAELSEGSIEIENFNRSLPEWLERQKAQYAFDVLKTKVGPGTQAGRARP